MCRYVYDSKMLQTEFGQVCVGMCRYVYDSKMLQTEFGQVCVSMCCYVLYVSFRASPSATEKELDECIEDKNVANVLPNATYCLCDAEKQEMCDPNASNQLQVSILAMLTTLIVIRF